LAENHHRSTNGTMETCQNWWIRPFANTIYWKEYIILHPFIFNFAQLTWVAFK
jgi:hypothetical protein